MDTELVASTPSLQHTRLPLQCHQFQLRTALAFKFAELRYLHAPHLLCNQYHHDGTPFIQTEARARAQHQHLMQLARTRILDVRFCESAVNTMSPLCNSTRASNQNKYTPLLGCTLLEHLGTNTFKL